MELQTELINLSAVQAEIGIIGFIQAAVVAIIAALFNMKYKKQDVKQEKRACVRAKESMLAIKLTSANINLNIATAMALRTGEVSEALDVALEEAKYAKKCYEDFLDDMAAEKLYGS